LIRLSISISICITKEKLEALNSVGYQSLQTRCDHFYGMKSPQEIDYQTKEPSEYFTDSVRFESFDTEGNFPVNKTHSIDRS